MSAGAAATGSLGGGAGGRTQILPAFMTPDAPTAAMRSSESPTQIAIERLKRDRIAQVAAVVFTLLIVACIGSGAVAHWVGRGADTANLSGTVQRGGHAVQVVDVHGVPKVGPGLHRQYLLGADQLGRDVFVRVLAGGKVSFEVGFGAALVTTLFATLLGILAGYRGGRWDTVISRYFDIQWAFPQLILAIALSSALASGKGVFIFQRGSISIPICIIGFVSIPYLGRAVRSQALVIAKREYIEASEALGANHIRIMVTQVLPNVMTLVISYFALMVGLDIVAEAGLSFLGVGVLPPTPSWGNIMSDGKAFYSTAWWISLAPGLLIGVTVLCLNLMAQSLEQALNPKGLK